MIGDKLVITDYHREGARKVWAELGRLLDAEARRPLVVTVAGESGSGKSETAHCVAEIAGEAGHRCRVLCQDDYFRLPPRSNHERRLEGLDWVGPSEVRLDLFDAHLEALKTRPDAPLEKPLVYFEENRIGKETLEPGALDVVVAEGTYTSLLEKADLRAFIDRTYRQNRKAREKRARDPDLDFLESVLAIEHEVIRAHRALADVVIPAPEDEAHLR